jgi:hypothetical protein
MSNKRKRSTSSGATRTNQPVRQISTPATRHTTAAEFNPDYTFVINDLKRIGTLAGSFIVILVVLSFFLR